MDRAEIQNLYIRICRDSGWQMDYIEATKFVGRLINISPLEVWCKFASLDQMAEIASGSHPECKITVDTTNKPS